MKTVKIISWENDGDDYKTQYLYGVEDSDLPFIKAVCGLFDKAHVNYGNECTDGGFLREEIDELITEHSPSSRWVEMFDGDDIHQILQDNFYGTPEGYDFDFCRVVESVTIEDYVAPAVAKYDQVWAQRVGALAVWEVLNDTLYELDELKSKAR